MKADVDTIHEKAARLITLMIQAAERDENLHGLSLFEARRDNAASLMVHHTGLRPGSTRFYDSVQIFFRTVNGWLHPALTSYIGVIHITDSPSANRLGVSAECVVGHPTLLKMSLQWAAYFPGNWRPEFAC